MINILSTLENEGFINLVGKPALSIKDKIEAEQLGKLLPQDKHGTTIYDVKSKAGVKNTASSQGSLSIAPHTDGVLVEHPPKYVALFGKEVPENEACRTHVCKISYIFNNLTSEEIRLLKLTHSSEGVFRYSFQQSLYNNFWISEEELEQRSSELSPEVKSALQSMIDVFEKFGQSFSIGQGDLLIIDNYNTLHYRDNLTSSGRHLLRYWICENSI